LFSILIEQLGGGAGRTGGGGGSNTGGGGGYSYSYPSSPSYSVPEYIKNVIQSSGSNRGNGTVILTYWSALVSPTLRPTAMPTTNNGNNATQTSVASDGLSSRVVAGIVLGTLGFAALLIAACVHCCTQKDDVLLGSDDKASPARGCTLGRVQRGLVITSELFSASTSLVYAFAVATGVNVPWAFAHRVHDDDNYTDDAHHDDQPYARPAQMNPQFLWAFLVIWLMGELLSFVTTLLQKYRYFYRRRDSLSSMLLSKLFNFVSYFFVLIGTAGFFASYVQITDHVSTVYSRHVFRGIWISLIFMAVGQYTITFAAAYFGVFKGFTCYNCLLTSLIGCVACVFHCIAEVCDSPLLGSLFVIAVGIVLASGWIGSMLLYIPIRFLTFLFWGWWIESGKKWAQTHSGAWPTLCSLIDILSVIEAGHAEAVNFLSRAPCRGLMSFMNASMPLALWCALMICLFFSCIAMGFSFAMFDAVPHKSFIVVCDSLTGNLGPFWIVCKVVQFSIGILLPLLRLYAVAKLHELAELIALYPKVIARSFYVEILQIFCKLIDNKEAEQKVTEVSDEIKKEKMEIEKRIQDIANILLDYEF
jgi:hypothetical protein